MMAITKTGQLVIMVALFMLQYLAEHLFPQTNANNGKANEWKNIKWGLLGWTLNVFPAFALAKWLDWLNVQQWGFFKMVQMAPIIALLVFIFLMDLWMYWWHRMNHEVKLLWRFHQLHHTDEQMNTTTVLRFHFAELLLSNIMKAGVYMLLGPSIAMVIVYELLFFGNVLFHHSNIRMEPFKDRCYRILFSSPLMHRLHHSVITQERNSNYGSIFSWWDRMFGSYKKNDRTTITSGIEHTTGKQAKLPPV